MTASRRLWHQAGEAFLRALNWWAFVHCLTWPRGMKWTAKFAPTRFAFTMFFRHVTSPAYDWIRREA